MSGFKGGTVELQENNVRVRFPYDKQRFKAIKRIRSARYNKSSKAWILPVENLVDLLSLEDFAPGSISYTFSLDQAKDALEKTQQVQKEVWERIRANPFTVHEEDILAVSPEVVVRLDKTKSSLRVTIRAGSKARKIITGIVGSHYLRGDASYYIPVEKLSSLLKALRDLKLNFVVEQTAGEYLSHGAELRQRIIEEAEQLTEAELKQALLGPYIKPIPESDNLFALEATTIEHLKICFPKLKAAPARKKRAQVLNVRQLVDVLHEAKKSDLKIWLPVAVKSFLEALSLSIEQEFDQNYQEFSDSLFYICQPEICLLYEDSLGVGFVLKKQSNEKLKDTLLGKLEAAECLDYLAYSDYFFIKFSEDQLEPSEQQLANFFDRIPCSKSYVEYKKLLKQRQEYLKRRDYFLSQTDWSAFMANTELEQQLFPHQRVAVAWLCEYKQGLLGDDMGLGKTLSILAGFDELVFRKDVDFLLVVCPNSLVKNWLREVERWVPKLNIAALPEKKRDKEEFLASQSSLGNLDGLVINYESFRLDYVYPKLCALAKARSVFLTLDESQRVKNHQSKSYLALRDIVPLCKRRILLSGTPTPRDITDIWSQMFLIDLGERFGTSYYRWLETVAELGTKWSQYAVKSFDPAAVKQTVSRVHEVLLRRTKEQVIDLPEKLFSVRDIILTGDQKKRYEQIRKELLVRIRSTDGALFVREVESILEQYLRAVQLASNPRILDPEWKGDPAKFVELDAILDELVGEQERKVVIWTNYLKNIDELTERYKSYGALSFSGRLSQAERATTIDEFQSSSKAAARVLVAIPAAGGVGITLTAAQTAIYLDKTWNAEHWMQSIDRIHRIGQQGTVNVISLHASKVDEVVANNLIHKQKQQSEVLGDQTQSYQVTRPTRAELLAAVA